MELSIQLVTALTALCAVLLSPLVALYTVKRETNATVLSGNRQQWINNLRDELAIFVSEVTKFSSMAIASETTAKEVQEQTVKLDRLRTKIRLMLNPSESDHKDLNLLCTTALAIATNQQLKKRSEFPELLAENNENIINLSQAILKKEWERVKGVK